MKKIIALVVLVAIVSVAQAYLISRDVEVVKAMMKSMPGLVSPFGYEWDERNPDRACCFESVSCRPYAKDGQACDQVTEPQVIDSLDMTGNVGGPFPANFGDLKNLTSLTMERTRLVGPLPDSFSKLINLEDIEINGPANLVRFPNIMSMPKLHTIYLTDLTFAEGLPDHWGPHPTLKYIRINHCGVKGTIPAAWNNWKSLRVLDLGHNELSGTIPGFTGAKSLDDVTLNDNQFTGKLPEPLGSTIRIVDFDDNFLSGTIPASWKLRLTYLRNNSLVGTIPDVYDGVNIDGYIVSYNKLTGTVPQSLVNKDKNYYVLNLSYNNLDLCPAPPKISFGFNSKCNLLGQATVPPCSCADQWRWCKLDCKD